MTSRMYKWIRRSVLAVLLVILGLVLYVRTPARLRVAAIDLPPGFTIGIYARGVENARSMALGDSGTLFVGTRSAGDVYAVRDTNGDFHADEVLTIATGLYMPNGVAFWKGALFIAEVHRVIRFDRIEERLDDPPAPVVVSDGFPVEPWHGWRYLRFGPDRMLYVSVGVPCNICQKDDERFATIMRLNPDGTGLEIFARGVRNSVGFDWHPETEELWFTDNGRDWLGNNRPPDELNRVPTPGLHFGYPYCHGGTVSDPEFGDRRSCVEFESPVHALRPHVAALGMRFYTGDMFPDAYRGQIFIAEHGSWNRVPPIGYRISRVRLEENRASEYEVFADGWLRAGRASGRPVDVLILRDGSLLVSDDRGGLIYRIAYGESE